jgi:biopolymer transport protein ExbB/biopolymer transport protein TolQ
MMPLAQIALGKILLLTTLVFQNSEGTKAGFGLREAIGHMGPIALAVVAILMLMSIYSIAVMLERWLTFRTISRKSREFVPKIAEKLRAARIEDALQLTRDYRKSHLAVVMNSGLQEMAAASGDLQAKQIRRAKRALRRAAAMKTAELQRGLASLATIGSTAPFVGLFGTVIGIIDAFEAMNREQTAGIMTVAGGISEALYTTAFGLIVAIPAVWLFNYFSNRVSGFAVEMKNSSEELMDFLTAEA